MHRDKRNCLAKTTQMAITFVFMEIPRLPETGNSNLPE
jgi:hypothetical protein